MKPHIISFFAIALLYLSPLWGQSENEELVFSISTLLNPESSIENLIQLAQKQKDSDVDLALSTISYAEELAEKYHCEHLSFRTRFYHSLYLLHKGENKKSLEMIEEILPYFQRSIYPWHEATLYNRLGSIYVDAAELDKAIIYLDKAITILKKLGRKGSLSYAYRFLAEVYSSKGSHAQALEYSYKALELAQETSSIPAHFLAWATLGQTYLSLEDFEEAESYFQLAMHPSNRHKNPIFWTRPLNKLGIIAFRRGELEKAHNFLIESLFLHHKYDNQYCLPETYYYLGKLALKNQDIPEALCYMQASKQASRNKQGIREELKADLGLAELYGMTQNHVKTHAIALRVLIWAQKNKDYELLHTSAAILADCAETMGAYRKAYEFRTLHQMASDSVLNAEKAKQITAIQIRNLHQQQEIEQALKLKEQKQAYVEQLEQSSSRVQKLMGAIGLFFLLTILFVRINYLRKKAGKELQLKNFELEVAEQDLANKNLALKQYIESNLQLENFAYMASHDLKAPLNNILSFSKLLAKSSLHKLSSKEQDFVNFIITGASNMQALIEALLNFSQVDSKKLQLDWIRPIEILDEVQIFLSAEIEKSQAEIIFEDLPERIYADRLKLYQLFQNLFSNALKFSRESSFIQIQVSSKEFPEYWQFAITDSGIGIAPEFQDRIFMIFKRLHTQDQIEGTGIGLALCKKIVEQHEGQIWVKSKKGEGSTFFFTLKKFQVAEQSPQVSVIA